MILPAEKRLCDKEGNPRAFRGGCRFRDEPARDNRSCPVRGNGNGGLLLTPAGSPRNLDAALSSGSYVRREDKNPDRAARSARRWFPRAARGISTTRARRNTAKWKNSGTFFMPHVDQARHLYSCRVCDIFSKYYFTGAEILFLCCCAEKPRILIASGNLAALAAIKSVCRKKIIIPRTRCPLPACNPSALSARAKWTHAYRARKT